MKLKLPKFNPYSLTIILILLIAIFLRFWQVNNRWSIFSDSARDILVARESLKRLDFPLVGSFSSAGPFVFGPLFYWFISVAYLPNINFLILPWLAIGVVSVLTVLIMAEAGRQLENEHLGILTALLTAVSFAQVRRSLALTQHTFIAITGALIVLTFISYLKKRKSIYVFFMGLAIGIALSMHYQAINFLAFAVIIFLPRFNLKKILSAAFYLIVGIIIPSLPLLYWDSQQNWANIRNLLDYLFVAQNRIYVPNRWLTYLFQFWPEFWGSVVGGNFVFGWLFAVLAVFFISQKLIKHQLKQSLLWLIIIFLIQFILLRYHKGERFEGYLIYFHPLILLFSAWVIWQLWQKWFSLAMLILLLTIIFNIKAILPELKSQNQRLILTEITTTLKNQYPSKKFQLYDWANKSTAYSFGLSAFLDSQGLIDRKHGYPIGVCISDCPTEVKVISDIYQPTKVIDLETLDNWQRQKSKWQDVSGEAVFEDIVLWWQKERLKSTFSLQKFILQKLKLSN